MTSGEHNLTRSIIAELETDATLAAVPPKSWDSADPAAFPRLSVKVTQGEEMVYLRGVYRYACSIDYTAKAKLSQDGVTAFEDIKARLSRLLLDNQLEPELPSVVQPIHDRLTDDHFHAFGVEPGAFAVENRPDANRKISLRFGVVGFDKDRLA